MPTLLSWLSAPNRLTRLAVAAGHERRARRGADRLRDVEAGEARSLGRQAIEIRRLECLCAKAADVAVALIVGEDEDDVGGRGAACPTVTPTIVVQAIAIMKRWNLVR